MEWVDSHSKVDLLSQMELLSGPAERLYPRNVALMMFTKNPEKLFPYSRVEIVHFPNGVDDPSFTEAPAISGPVPQMIRQTLLCLKTTVLQEIPILPGWEYFLQYKRQRKSRSSYRSIFHSTHIIPFSPLRPPVRKETESGQGRTDDGREWRGAFIYL